MELRTERRAAVLRCRDRGARLQLGAWQQRQESSCCRRSSAAARHLRRRRRRRHRCGWLGYTLRPTSHRTMRNQPTMDQISSSIGPRLTQTSATPHPGFSQTWAKVGARCSQQCRRVASAATDGPDFVQHWDKIDGARRQGRNVEGRSNWPPAAVLVLTPLVGGSTISCMAADRAAACCPRCASACS